MTLQASAALLCAAFLFGGMTLYSFGFAAFLFTNLPGDEAGQLLRKAFPHFYLWLIFTSVVTAALFYALDTTSLGLMVAIALSGIFARQALMPAINRASDSGDKRRFNRLHGLSVLIGLVQIGAAGVVLVRQLA